MELEAGIRRAAGSSGAAGDQKRGAMRVSVVVPVYNVDRYLRECLDSLKSQTLVDMEFVCVDDGSTDGSLSILREYADADNRFRVISKPNAGYGHTLNRGIEAARGEYLGVVESDDFCAPEMFEALYAKASSDGLDIVRSSYYLYWSSPVERREKVASAPEADCGTVFDPRAYRECFFFHPALWTMLVRRSLVFDNGLKLLETPGASYQDTSFSFKLWACARRASVVEDAFLFYRQDNEASSINQRGKLECVPEEYRELERFLLEDESRFGDLVPVMMRRKFLAYLWNYGRLAEGLHEEFAGIASAEFRSAAGRGLLDQSLFTSDEWSDLCLLVRDPARFVALRDSEGSIALSRFRKAERFRRAIKRGTGL